MFLKKHYYPLVLILMTLLPLLLVSFQGCGDSTVGESDIMPECIVVGRFVEFRGPTPDGLYEMDIEIVESHDLGQATNPTRDKIGKKITVFTLEYSEAILPNEVIAAHIGLYGEKNEAFLFAKNLHPAVLSTK